MTSLTEPDRAYLVHRIAGDIADAFARINHTVDDDPAKVTAAAVVAVAYVVDEVHHVGWRNPRTGVLHRLKLGTLIGPDWQELWTVEGGG